MISGPNFSLTLYANVCLSMQWQQQPWCLESGLCCEDAWPVKHGVGRAAKADPAADTPVGLCRGDHGMGCHPYLSVFFPGRKPCISITLRAIVNT